MWGSVGGPGLEVANPTCARVPVIRAEATTTPGEGRVSRKKRKGSGEHLAGLSTVQSGQQTAPCGPRPARLWFV